MPDIQQRKRILVVDDNNDHLYLVKLVLERRGYEVIILNDPGEFVDHVQAYQPALIFMDQNMPILTGIEAIKALKVDRVSRNIPIIFFTGRNDVEELAKMSGADDWLKKPFRLEELITKAEKFLEPSSRK